MREFISYQFDRAQNLFGEIDFLAFIVINTNDNILLAGTVQRLQMYVSVVRFRTFI